MSHLSPAAQHAVDEARAVMQSKRESCCRHGVNRDICADCQRQDDRDYRATPSPQPRDESTPEMTGADA